MRGRIKEVEWKIQKVWSKHTTSWCSVLKKLGSKGTLDYSYKRFEMKKKEREWSSMSSSFQLHGEIKSAMQPIELRH